MIERNPPGLGVFGDSDLQLALVEIHVGPSDVPRFIDADARQKREWQKDGVKNIITEQDIQSTAATVCARLPPRNCVWFGVFQPTTGLTLKMVEEFLQRQAGLFDDSFKSSGLEGFVLRHDDCPRSVAQNKMRACLAKLDKSTAF